MTPPYFFKLLDRIAQRTFLRQAITTLAAVAILIADILTGSKAIAVIVYVPLLVGVATRAPQREVFGFGGLSAVFALLAFGVTASHHAPGGTVWPLAMSLVNIAATTALLGRFVASREALQATQRILAQSEWRYQTMFNRSRFPVGSRDFTAAFAIYARLRAQGVTDLLAYNRRNPELAGELAACTTYLEYNDAMRALFKLTTHVENPKSMAEIGSDPVSMLTLHQMLFDGVTTLDRRTVITTLDGRRIDLWTVGRLSPEPQRVLQGFAVDLTERERPRRDLAAAQAELARASRIAAVGALSASIAHELNQPLGATLMDAQTCLRYLRREPPDTEAAIVAAERVAAEGARARDIVRRTFESVTRRGAQDEPVDLNALIREALKLVDPGIREFCVEVEVDLPGGTVELLADRIALQQVLVNLFANAIQAMRETDAPVRRLSIRLVSDQREATIEVRDTGPGIASENLSRLFEPFFTTKTKGVGVGLAISRSAVEARGGVLRARNSDGGGAVFECRLPITREAA